MNKNKKLAFSLIEAMIILVLISVAVLAMVPIISKETTGVFLKRIEDNNREYLIFGRKVNQNLGIGVNNLLINTAKLVTDTAAIEYNDNNPNSIQIGHNCDNNNPPTCTNVQNNAGNKILIGQNVCTNANQAISIGNSNDADNCDVDNIIQIGANDGTAIIQTDTETIFRINNGEVLKLDGDDFDFNLPNGDNAPIDMFNYTSNNNTLTFSQSVDVNGSTTFTTWGQDIAQVDIDTAKYPYCKTNPAGGFFGNGVTTKCEWLCDTFQPNQGVCTQSDKRLKNIISDYSKGFDSVKEIETFLYTFKNDAKKKIHAGLIAQKLQGLFDEALHEDEKGYLSYEKEPILYAMVNSVKEIYASHVALAKKQRKANSRADRLLYKYSD